MTPIERAARAVFAMNKAYYFPSGDLVKWEDAPTAHPECVRTVRAVLESVRDPTARMVVAGGLEVENGDGELHARKWRAMIDAALAETAISEIAPPPTVGE